MKTLFLICSIAFLTGNISAQTSWYQIPTNTTKKLNTINFPTADVGYIGGNDSLLLKSTDGGATWSEVNYSGVTFYPGEEHILNLKFVSDLIGYMTTGPYGGTYKTINGGNSWTQIVPAGNLCFNEGLFFFDEQNGFIGGSGCFQGELIEKTTSGTISTTTINTSTNVAENRVLDIDFLNSNYGLAASYSGYILRTTNGGLVWDTIPSGLGTGIPLTSVIIINDTLAYAGYNDLGSGFGILKTTDAGLSWTMEGSMATFYYPAYLCLHQSENGYVYSGAIPALGTAGLIFESSAYGAWSYYDVDHPINDMSSHSDSIVFGVGDNGYAVVNTPLTNLNLPNNSSNNSSVGVFPNPVIDELFIQVPSQFSDQHFSVQLYSLNGQLIFNDSDVRSIDVRSLHAGIYILQLVSSKEISTTRFVKN